jgi:iron complex outermembrane receptor protein
LLKAKTSYLSESYGKFSLQMSQQNNERMEYDLHKPRGVSASYNRPELSFFLSTLHSELLWESPLIDTAWSLVAGISGQQQKNTTQGRFLIPDFTGTVLGGFFTTTWQRGAWEAELGLRYDWRWLNTTQNKGRADSSLFFNRWASAAGLSYRVNSSLKIGAQLASTWRAPSVNELYSNGVHHGTASFETGKASMKPENAYNGSVSLQWQSHELSAELGAYINYIDNFIYLQPQAPVTVLTVRGAFPLFNYTQANVLMRGIDWSSELHITERWHWSVKTALVRSYNITDDEYLIFTPADRLQSAISYHLPNSIRRSQTSFNVNVTRVGKQTRTPANGDYAPAPSGYVLFGLGAGSQWLVDDKHHLHVNISVDNLLNTAYRDYLNRFRYFAYDVGRSVSLRLRYEF